MSSVPYDRIDVVLLDAGGTLVSVDFEWIHRELSARGVACTLEELERAEAAARPAVSREFTRRLERREPLPSFASYFAVWLEHLAAATGCTLDAESLAAQLAPVLRPPGESYRLWTRLLPGVGQALRDLVEMGVRLAVVSNSDGSAERSIAEAGLRPYFDLVVDSEIVGFEKPDPRIFAHTIAALGCDPARTLHVGDMYFADVAGARNAGIHTVLLDPWDDWSDADCARVADVAAVRDRIREARGFHLAQVNIALMKGPLESAVMSEFAARIDEINALAERSPGYIWRLQGDSGNATYLRPYDDDRILFNLSVWRSIEDLRAYAYGGPHAEVFRRRQAWFDRFEGVQVALWWVKAGHVPSVEEAKARLAHLAEHGPTSEAFSLKTTFAPPPMRATAQINE